jgi:hypothetical protein
MEPVEPKITTFFFINWWKYPRKRDKGQASLCPNADFGIEITFLD